MKANEIPEKIFISYETDEDGRIYPDYMWHRHQFEGVENIEYTRTDAFMKKACRWLDEIYTSQECLSLDDIEEFKKYMEE